MKRFADKTALVTGGASGIGAATARRLAEEGADVVVTDIDDARGWALAAEIGGRYLRLDATSEFDWAGVAAHLGELDVLLLNVGRKPPERTPPHELGVWEWDHVQVHTLRSAFLGVRAAIPLLRRRAGCVVVTGSIHALVGIPGATAYAAAKGGLDAMVRQLAAEYAPSVRVNAVHPGPIRTPSWGGWNPDEHIARTLVKRAGDPADVAAAVAFLASADAAYVTGAALPVDGGWHANGM